MKQLRILLTIVIILVTTSTLAIANESATVVRQGEDVLQTTDGKIYVGQGLSFSGQWVTIFNVRYPVLPDGIMVGAATFHADKITIIYHKGAIDHDQAALPK